MQITLSIFDIRYNNKFATDGTNYTMEGCFCPHGTTLFNTVYGTCVPSCGCVGPDGKPKQVREVPKLMLIHKWKAWTVCLYFCLHQPGETWTSDCNTCVCDNDSMSIQCEPVQCPSVQSPVCSDPAQQLVNKTEGCCKTQACGKF